jgi:hypothetical protein
LLVHDSGKKMDCRREGWSQVTLIKGRRMMSPKMLRKLHNLIDNTGTNQVNCKERNVIILTKLNTGIELDPLGDS